MRCWGRHRGHQTRKGRRALVTPAEITDLACLESRVDCLTIVPLMNGILTVVLNSVVGCGTLQEHMWLTTYHLGMRTVLGNNA